MSGITDINFLYEKYYGDNPVLRRIVTIHSEQVAKKAIELRNQKKLDLDPQQLYIAALLHDIGVVKCNAPSIYAYGEKPYLLHGLEGAKILKENNLLQFADYCRTHTGSGLTAEEIINNDLPLPAHDYLPSTLSEKLICYSDKFFSKSKNLTEEKTLDQVINQITKFGEEPLSRFLDLHALFS